MAQNTVFAQIVKLIPRSKFETWVRQYEGDKSIKELDCWSWFGALLFGQLSGHNSIRAIERIFTHGNPLMKGLGFSVVRKSTLSDANKKRPLGILEEALEYSLKKAKDLAPKHTFKLKGDIFVLDATMIRLSLGLSPWAQYHSQHRGGKGDAIVKLTTAIDLAGDLPTFAVVTPGVVADIRAAKRVTYKAGSTLVFDKAYRDFAWLNQLNKTGISFVTRQCKGFVFKVAKSRNTDRTLGHICDQVIYRKGISKAHYKGKLRRISYRDPDTGKKLIFITNNFTLSTQTICDLYKARWKVEVFFKTLKQNLKIKKFMGVTLHAVKAQILAALIAYILIQIWRFMLKARLSMPDVMAVIALLLLIKAPLALFLGPFIHIKRHPPPLQLELNL
jgi:hypothetical protein